MQIKQELNAYQQKLYFTSNFKAFMSAIRKILIYSAIANNSQVTNFFLWRKSNCLCSLRASF